MIPLEGLGFRLISISTFTFRSFSNIFRAFRPYRPYFDPFSSILWLFSGPQAVLRDLYGSAEEPSRLAPGVISRMSSVSEIDIK